ncbi:MAG: rod shape-determining protein [Patescibacteria group bacterium]|nr:rod shape-determining protein [Patescibacteria group bacterium]
MFDKIFSHFSKDVGLDLGTTNTRIYLKGRGLVINQPSLVAINTRVDQLIAIGFGAKKMLGKAPTYVSLVKPIENGVVTDFEVTEKMLRHAFNKIYTGFFSLTRPRAIVAVPLDITEVEKKSFEDVIIQAGAREVFLVERPVAAAIGMRLPVNESVGNLVAEIGGGLTEVAVIALNGIVAWKSLKIGGETWSRNIWQYVKEKFNLLLGEQTIEEIKIKIGSAFPQKEKREMKVKGRDLITGLPKEISLTDEEIREAISPSVNLIVEAISDTIEKTPPELVADILNRGILLSGGGAMLKGLDQLVNKKVKIPTHLTDDPLTSVVRGLGFILEDFENLKTVLLPSSRE